MKGFTAWALDAARTIWRGVLVVAAMGAFIGLMIGILELFRWQWVWLRWPLLAVGILLGLAFLGSVTRPGDFEEEPDPNEVLSELADADRGARPEPAGEELR